MFNIEGRRRQLLTAVDLATHLILAFMLAGFFRRLTLGWAWPVLGFTGGVLIDLDHFIDYFFYYGWRFDLGDFFNHRYKDSGRCYIIFHSWELLIALWVFSAGVLWITPVVTGMTVHVLTDYLFHPQLGVLRLSLLYRWRHGLKRGRISFNCR
ncbi:MAG: hypothetical protein ABID83_04385 [Candidatus Omnitrophota bacterium]